MAVFSILSIPLPLETSNVVVLPFVNVIVYVSTKPLVDVFVIEEIPFPVKPVGPTFPFSATNCQYIVLVGRFPIVSTFA